MVRGRVRGKVGGAGRGKRYLRCEVNERVAGKESEACGESYIVG